MSLCLAVMLLAAACSDDEGSTAEQVTDEFGRTLVDGNGDPVSGDPSADLDTSEENSNNGVQSDSVSSVTTTTQPPDPERVPPNTDALAEQVNVDPEAEGEQPEPGSGTPDLAEELEKLELVRPCDLYEAADLSSSISAWSATAGVFAELPSGLGNDITVEFNEVSSTDATCEWFSDEHVWFVGVSWDVADPTFIETFSQRFDDNPAARAFDTPIARGFVTDDSTAQILTDGLLITVNNLVPGSQGVTGDIDVTEALARDIAALLA